MLNHNELMQCNFLSDFLFNETLTAEGFRIAQSPVGSYKFLVFCLVLVVFAFVALHERALLTRTIVKRMLALQNGIPTINCYSIDIRTESKGLERARPPFG